MLSFEAERSTSKWEVNSQLSIYSIYTTYTPQMSTGYLFMKLSLTNRFCGGIALPHSTLNRLAEFVPEIFRHGNIVTRVLR